MGIPEKSGYDMYSWKHTGVIALWAATQNIRLIQQQCRHSTAVQTETYLQDLGIIVRHTQIQDFPEFELLYMSIISINGNAKLDYLVRTTDKT